MASQFISTSLEENVQNLWKIENDGLDDSDVSWSQEDRQVIELWDEECKVADGHYEIPIPWKSNVDGNVKVKIPQSQPPYA